MKAEAATHAATHAAALRPSVGPRNSDPAAREAFASLLDGLVAADDEAVNTFDAGGAAGGQDSGDDKRFAAPDTRCCTDVSAIGMALLPANLMTPATTAQTDRAAGGAQTPTDGVRDTLAAVATGPLDTMPDRASLPANPHQLPNTPGAAQPHANISLSWSTHQLLNTPGAAQRDEEAAAPSPAALAARSKGRAPTAASRAAAPQLPAAPTPSVPAADAAVARPIQTAAAALAAASPGTPGADAVGAAAASVGGGERPGAGAAHTGSNGDGRSSGAAMPGVADGPPPPESPDGGAAANDFGLALGEALHGAFEAIGTQVSLWSAGRAQRASFDVRDGLDTPLTVDVQVTDGVAQLQFRTDDAALRQLIQAQAPTALADAMARAGLVLGQVDVGARGQGGDRPADPGRSGRTLQTRVALTGPAAAAAHPMRRGSAALDVYA